MLRDLKQKEATVREQEIRTELESMSPRTNPNAFNYVFQLWLDAVDEKQRYE